MLNRDRDFIKRIINRYLVVKRIFQTKANTVRVLIEWTVAVIRNYRVTGSTKHGAKFETSISIRIARPIFN